MAANVEVKIKLNDQASAGLKKIGKEAEAAATKSAKVAEQMASKSSAAVENSVTKSRSQYEKLASARTQLGVRSEKSVQNEIKQTEAAYNRLARSGAASARELARAQDASINKIKQLKNELKGLEKSGGRGLVTGGVLAAGAYSTFAATKSAYEQNLSLDERLGLRANAAYRGKTVAQKRAGEASMRLGIKSGVAGGLTTDESMDTLDELIAKNQVGGVDNAIKLLPQIAKFKAGQGGSPVEAASLISTLMGSGFAKDEAQAMRQMDMVAAAGGAGAFETADLAKHLPNLLATAKTQGYVGDAGLKRVLVMLEQGMTTAGSADESANNLKNLLNKMNSGDTAKDFEKMGRGDLSNTMLKAAAAGKTPDQVYLEVIEQETKNNPKLKAALKLAATAKDDQEREERIKAVNELAKGQAIGKLFQDMQAKGAFLALLNDAFGKEVGAAIDKSSGIVDKDAEYMQDKTGFKKRVSNESTKLASFDAAENLNPLMNIYYENMTKLATQYPLLTGSANLATGALTAMAGAALLNLPGGILPKTAGVLPKVSGVLPKAGKLLKGAGIAGVAVGVGGYALDAVFGEDSAVARYGSSALNGASAGALIGSFVPGLGTAVGAAIGGSLGLLIEAMKSPVLKSPEAAKVETTVKIMPSPDFRVQSQTTKTSGPVKNTIHTGNLREGAMW